MVDKRTVVTVVLCSVAALGASAAMTQVVPSPDAQPSAHAKAAPAPKRPTPSPSRSQSSAHSQLTTPKPGGTPAPSGSATPGPASPAGKPTAIAGALFTGGLDGEHFCTATVVHSAGRNMIVTAGHCLVAGDQGDAGPVFAPAYENGSAPYGTWKVEKVFEDQHWSDDNNDDFDLAFARVAPDSAGRNIEDVTGAAPWTSPAARPRRSP